MAERIQGLSIELGLDTIKIDSGLGELKRKLAVVNSEMKSNMSAFDRGEKSVGKYETQISSLNKKLDVHKVAVVNAKNEYDRMVQIHGEGSKQADQAARAYNNEVAAVNNLERNIEGLTAEMKEMQDQQRLADSGWTKFGDKMESMGGKLTAVGDKMKGVGKSMSLKLTAPIVAGFTAAAKASIDYESAFAGVRKTVDMSEPEFAKLSKGIRDMSKELPASASEIAGVAEAAGQLGIKKESILGFTRTMTDLGVATNMSSDEAATALARLANITQMNQKDFDRLGSSIVALGNNFATTEKEIVDMSLRLAGAGAQVGMSEADIVALATALSSVGIEAEMGGSAISRVMVAMQVATSTGFTKVQELLGSTGYSLRDLQMMASHSGKAFGFLAEDLGMTKKELSALVKSGVDLENFANVAGLTGEQFKQAFEKDAVGAIGLFVEGLSKAGESGGTAVEMLQDMGITEIRLRDSLLRAGGASKVFTEAIELSNKAWDDNNALTNEADERYKTVASKLSMLKNTIVSFAIDIGNLLTPYIIKATDVIGGLFEKMSGMSDTTKKAIVVFAGLVAAIGPILVVAGTLTAGLGSILTMIGTVSGAIAVMTTGVASAIPAVSGLASVFTVLTGPIGLGIAAIAGITVGTIALVNHLKKDAIPEVDRFGGGVSKATKEALGGFFELSDGAGKALADMSINSKKVTQEMADSLSGKFKKMNEEILSGMKKRHDDQIAEMETFFLNSSAITDEREQEILRKQQVHNQAKETEQKSYEERIAQILQDAVDQKREITQNERDQINAIQRSMNENAVKYLTDNERDQKVILENMKNQAADLSARQAAEVVKNSAKARDKVIDDADKQYKDVYAFALKQRDETGTISAEEADKIIQEAKKKRDESVGHAKKTHEDVIKEAKGQAAEHVKEVDWETGEILSKWEAFTRDIKKMTISTSMDVTVSLSKMFINMKNSFVDGTTASVKTYKGFTTGLESIANVSKNKLVGTVTEQWSKINLATKAGSEATSFLWGKTKDSVVSIATSMYSKTRDMFDKIVKGATELPGKMRDGIVKMAHNAVSGIKTVGQQMANKFGAVVNGLIGGLNSITSKLGIKGDISKWTVPQFADGTDGHKGGLMVVGDKYGRELVELPNGKTFLSPDTDTLLNAPKGTRVIPNKITEKYLSGDIPHFSEGTGVGSWLKDKAKGFASAMSSVWDYMKSPSKLLDLIPLPKIEGLSGGMGTMAKGAVSLVKDKALEYIKNAFSKAGELGSKGGFPSPFHLTSRAGMRIHPIFKKPMMHYGDDWGAPAGTRIPSKSAGQVVASGKHAIRGNFVKVKSGPYELIYQHNTRNSVGVGDSVTPGQTIGTVGSTGRSTGPHLHFETWKNGNFVAPKSLGFASGAEVFKRGFYELAEEGHSEFVIPTAPKRRTDAMKLLALAAKKISGNNSGSAVRPNQMSNSGSGVFEQLLAATLEQNALLMQLLKKDTNLYVDGHELGHAVAPGASQGMHDMTNIKNLVRGY